MGKYPTSSRFLTAFLFTLYLSTPYLNLLPVPTFTRTPAAPSQNYGDTSLPPGTVTNVDTSDSNKSCGPNISPYQPLVTENNWSAVVSIPRLLFKGTASGPSITHRYAISSNGTFSARDDAGDSLAINPIEGLPPGQLVVTLKANGTKALQDFLVVAANSVRANVTVAYSVGHQYCQDAGLKISIEGSVSWSQGEGTVSLSFKHRPLDVRGGRAWFGNQSGEALGYDWKDSLTFNPSYDNASSTLSYTVGPTFSIDPVVVGTSQLFYPLEDGYQHHELCSAASRYWVFYENGLNYVFRSSSDGSSWSNETALTTRAAVGESGASYACSGRTIFYAAPADLNGGSKVVYYRYGTLNSDGTISWVIPESAMSLANYAISDESVAIDSNGDLWLADATCPIQGCPSPYTFTQSLEVWECTTPSACLWSPAGWPATQTQTGHYWPDILSVGNAQVAVIYGDPNTGEIAGTTYLGGGTWTPVSEAKANCPPTEYCSLYPNFAMGAAVSGDTVDVAVLVVVANSPYWEFPAFATYSASAGFSPLSYPDGTASYDCEAGCAMSSDGASDLVLWMGTANGLTYMTSSDWGATWGAKKYLDNTTLAGQDNVAAGYANGRPLVFYETGPFSPYITYEIMFALLPVVKPHVATPPWGEPGLSPYESYANNAVVYVSLGNGLVSIEQPTFSLPGRDLAVAPALFYNEPGAFWPSGTSPLQTDNYTYVPIANGWSLNLPWLGAYEVHLQNGQQYPYNWNGSSMQVHGPVDFQLASTSVGGICPCLLTLPSGIEYAFNSGRQLVKENDTAGNAITFSYNADGTLSTITDTVGRSTMFGYSGGRLASITAPSGRTWTFAYSLNRLSMTDPVRRTTSFVYASAPGNGWIIQEVDYPTGGAKVDLAYGAAVLVNGTSYVATSRAIYNAPGSISQSDSTSYTFVNGILTTDTMEEADGSGNVQGFVSNVFSDPTGKETTYMKGPTGVPFRITEDDFAGGRLTAVKTLDQSGNMLTESDASYDGWGNVVHTKDAKGHETWFSYVTRDSNRAFGSTSCSAFGFYPNSVPASIHDLLAGSCDFQDGPGSAQQESFYQYDALGELSEQRVSHDSGWLYTDYTYDGFGNVVSTRNADGNIVYYSYSPVDHGAYLTKTSQIAGVENITSLSFFDFETGFLVAGTDPDGQTTGYTYDAVGRPLTTTYPPVDGVSSVDQWSYDDANGIVTLTDPNGNVVREYFDGLGRETRLERWNGTSLYSTAYYTYNWMDKVASVRTPQGAVYTYVYDPTGRPLSQTNPDGTVRTVSYDDFLNIVTTTDEDGRQTIYSFDRDGRLVTILQYSAPTPTQAYTTNYVHDGVGNLLSVDNAIGQVTSYSYDDLNRLTGVTTPDGNSTRYGYDSMGNMVSKVTPNGAAISYSYDQANRLTAMAYPDGSSTLFNYDSSGNTLGITSDLSGSTADTYAYDAMGRLSGSAVTVAGSTYTTSYSYDRASNLVGITYPNGLEVPMAYDAVNRLRSVGNYAALSYNLDGTIASITFDDGEVQSYAYDSQNRPTSIVDAMGNTKLLALSYSYDSAGNVASVNNEKLVYDNMSRLVSAKGGGISATYAYDGAGNLLGSTSKNAATSYVGCGYYPNSVSGTVVRCGTDRDGNFISKTGGWTYTYDYEGQMTAAALNGVAVQTNTYDGAGNRVEKTEIFSTVFSYRGVNLLFEKDLSTGDITDHIYGDGMQLAKVEGGTTYYYHEDQTGSNRLVTYLDAKGKAATQFSSEFEPYGANYRPSGSEVFQYTDRMLDPATGLYYFNARFYDPSTMRLMTKDPLGGDSSDPTSQNSYAYAGGNPLSNTDPSGMETVFGQVDWTAVWNYIWSALGLPTESQARQALGLPQCGQDCQERHAMRWGWVSPLVGMVLPGETIFSLSTDEFDALIRTLGSEGSGASSRLATSYVQDRAAAILGGTTDVEHFNTPFGAGGRTISSGRRWFDIGSQGKFVELKFAGDPVTREEIEKDVWLREPAPGEMTSRANVWYLFIEGPEEGQVPSAADIQRVEGAGIPYMYWTWNQFIGMW